MKNYFFVFLLLLGFLAGCTAMSPDDDLRGVPVTNNPNLLPRSSQTAQGPSF